MNAALTVVQPDILSGPHTAREERGQRLANLFIGEMIPLLVQVRRDFYDKKPNETICGVRTFGEYCTGVLRYSERHIRRLMGGQNPATEKHDGSAHRKPKPHQVTDAEFAEYEKKYPHVRQSATNMLAQGMTPVDVVGALMGMGIPEAMAAAAVRIVSGGEPEPAKNPDLVAKIRAHEKAARDLTASLKQSGFLILQLPLADGEVHISTTKGKFHLDVRNLTAEQFVVKGTL